MSLPGTGVSTDDFDQIWTDMAVTVTHSVVTKTTDPLTGSETTTYATGTSKKSIFFLEQNRFIWDKEGLLSVGDAYVIMQNDSTIKRYDQVTYGGQTYYVENVTYRQVLTVGMQVFCTLFKVA